MSLSLFLFLFCCLGLYCPLGRSSPSSGSIECELCNEGSYSSLIGSRDCQLCTEGKYQNIKGQLKCQDCPLGTANNQTGGKRKQYQKYNRR